MAVQWGTVTGLLAIGGIAGAALLALSGCLALLLHPRALSGLEVVKAAIEPIKRVFTFRKQGLNPDEELGKIRAERVSRQTKAMMKNATASMTASELDEVRKKIIGSEAPDLQGEESSSAVSLARADTFEYAVAGLEKTHESPARLSLMVRTALLSQAPKTWPDEKLDLKALAREYIKTPLKPSQSYLNQLSRPGSAPLFASRTVSGFSEFFHEDPVSVRPQSAVCQGTAGDCDIDAIALKRAELESSGGIADIDQVRELVVYYVKEEKPEWPQLPITPFQHAEGLPRPHAEAFAGYRPCSRRGEMNEELKAFEPRCTSAPDVRGPDERVREARPATSKLGVHTSQAVTTRPATTPSRPASLPPASSQLAKEAVEPAGHKLPKVVVDREKHSKGHHASSESRHRVRVPMKGSEAPRRRAENVRISNPHQPNEPGSKLPDTDEVCHLAEHVPGSCVPEEGVKRREEGSKGSREDGRNEVRTSTGEAAVIATDTDRTVTPAFGSVDSSEKRSPAKAAVQVPQAAQKATHRVHVTVSKEAFLGAQHSPEQPVGKAMPVVKAVVKGIISPPTASKPSKLLPLPHAAVVATMSDAGPSLDDTAAPPAPAAQKVLPVPANQLGNEVWSVPPPPSPPPALCSEPSLLT